jgi:WhiB family redox-sensing transcriptional regulator
VMMECRRHGLEVREPFGVWGGLTEDEREEMYREERGTPPRRRRRRLTTAAEG